MLKVIREKSSVSLSSALSPSDKRTPGNEARFPHADKFQEAAAEVNSPTLLTLPGDYNNEIQAMSHRRYVMGLFVLLMLLWAPLAFEPFDRKDWLLENALLWLALVMLFATYRSFPLSRISYTLIFVFLCLHTIGAHYTYAEVPYDDWWRALTGSTFNEWIGWKRNNFDRVVHFSYGLLLAYPVRELFLRVAGVRGFWGYFLPLDLTMSTSMLYELIEWAAAEVFGGELGAAYLGTQGDVWDAHKDMALASLGALISMSVVALINSRIKRDFALEWNESLRIKHAQPLDEIALSATAIVSR
jgi:putative membrane protein